MTSARARPAVKSGGCWVLVLGLASGGMGLSLRAQEMPDPSLIHGRAIPAPELPDGTVTVRVVREAIGNNIVGQEVRIVAGNQTVTATTDQLGRAEFQGLPRGREARAESVVEGERLESQPFVVPTSGGLRVILVAGLARAAERRAREADEAAKAPPVRGAVVLGGNSRVLMQFEDDVLQVFYVLEIVNNARQRVDPGGPLVIELPPDAAGAATLEGSSPSASVEGRRLVIKPPFAPGTTAVQVGFRLPHRSSELVFDQVWPAPLERVVVGVEKVVPELALTSTQLTTTNEVRADNGTVFLLGIGPALPAGTPLRVILSNLPYHSRTPRNVALGLAAAILALGAWLAAGSRGRQAESVAALTRRRDQLLSELAQLEARRRAGTISSERYAPRRQRIMGELEQIYGELDDRGAGPQGGGEDLAA
jgi:hypothetical protein